MMKVLLAAGVVLLFAVAVVLYYGAGVWHLAPAGFGSRISVDERYWEVPDFFLVNSDGTSVGKADLEGKIWVAAFIFTRCLGPCPVITERMTEIQAAIPESEPFRLVSFTIDPEYDRPPVLRDYAEHWGADPRRWFFLTSEDPEEMVRVSSGFKVATYRDSDNQGSDVPNITHGTNLLLVGPEGYVRAVYGSESPEDSRQVADGVRQLLAAVRPSSG